MPLLPQLDTNGDWDEVRDRLYQCFQDIFFANPRLLVGGKLLAIDGRLIDDNKEEGFWHIVSKGPPGDRLVDFSRARCMPWIPAMLDGTAEGLSCWQYTEGSSKVRSYYWLENDHYVVILEEGRNVMTLVTAYFVEGWGAKDLMRRRAKGQPF